MGDPIRLRQICLLVPALEPVIDQLIAVMGLQVCYGKADLSRYGVPYTPPPTHQAAFFQKHGLASALLPIGDTFLELVAPLRNDTPAARFLDRRGQGGYMVITEVGTIEPFRARIDAQGARLAGTVDYPTYNELQVDPRDVGASMFSFSLQKEGEPFDGGWFPAGANWQEKAAPGFTAIRRAEISARDPAAVAARWATLIGRPAEAQANTYVITLDGRSEIRFVPSTNGQDRLTAIDVQMDGFAEALSKARSAELSADETMITIGGINIREERS
ncbi:VOC family protein [Mesorhizobium sp. A623]